MTARWPPPTRRRARGPSPRAASPSGEANDDRPGAGRQPGQGRPDQRRRHRDRPGDGARLRLLRRQGGDLRPPSGAARGGARGARARAARSASPSLRPARARSGHGPPRRDPGALRRRRRPRQQRGRPVHRAGRGGQREGAAGDRPAQPRRRLGADPRGRQPLDDPGLRRADRLPRLLAAPGDPRLRPRGAPRAGLENLASGLALEWSRHGIRTVCVVPGNIETEGLAAYGPEALEASRRQVPLGRLGRPRRWGRRSPSSPPRAAATSTAPASSSTAASTPGARASRRPPRPNAASPR